jgi:hypothetical protein
LGTLTTMAGILWRHGGPRWTVNGVHCVRWANVADRGVQLAKPRRVLISVVVCRLIVADGRMIVVALQRLDDVVSTSLFPR